MSASGSGVTSTSAVGPLRVGLDVDGVFVDFNGQPGGHGFVQTLIDVCGRDPFGCNPYHPTTFHYWKQHAVRSSEVSKAWAAIDASPDWWARLQPHEGAIAVLERLSVASINDCAMSPWLHCHYLTARRSLSAARQTEEWLYRYGPRADVWANCDEAAKGHLCKALQLDVMVDDKWENLVAVREACPDITLFLVRRSWNEKVNDFAREGFKVEHIDLDELPTRLWNLQAARQAATPAPGASVGETATPKALRGTRTRGTGRARATATRAGTTGKSRRNAR